MFKINHGSTMLQHMESCHKLDNFQELVLSFFLCAFANHPNLGFKFFFLTFNHGTNLATSPCGTCLHELPWIQPRKWTTHYYLNSLLISTFFPFLCWFSRSGILSNKSWCIEVDPFSLLEEPNKPKLPSSTKLETPLKHP